MQINKKVKSKTLTLILFLILSASMLYSSTLVVGTCEGGTYSTIQDAINAASTGDTIAICSGTYNESIETKRDNLTIKGLGSAIDDVVINGSISLNSKNITFDNFKIKSNSSGIEGHTTGAGSHTFKNLIIESKDTGIYVSAGGKQTFQNLTITSSSGMGIHTTNNVKGDHTFDHININSKLEAIYVGYGGTSFTNLDLNSTDSTGLRIDKEDTNTNKDANFAHININTPKGMGIIFSTTTYSHKTMRDINITSKGRSIYSQRSLALLTDANLTSSDGIGLDVATYTDLNISNVQIHSKYDSIIFHHGGDVSINVEHSSITSTSGFGIDAEKASNLTVKNLCINSYNNGINILTTAKNAHIINNKITSTHAYAISVTSDPLTHATINNNCLYGDKLAQSNNYSNNFDSNYWDGVSIGWDEMITYRDAPNKINWHVIDYKPNKTCIASGCSGTTPIQNEDNKFRDFAIRNPKKTRNIKGNVKFIGNTVLKYNYANPYHYTNADLYLRYVDVDNNSSTYNSSKAKLDMPTDSTIVWAGLYTQGYLKGTTSVNGIYQILDKPVYLTAPSIGTISVAPNIVDYAINKNNRGDTYGYTYDTYTEIKNLEGKKASEVNGWITAANIKCYEGTDKSSGLGNFGAWTLVVVYKNPNEKLKNISVFDGYKKVAYKTGYKEVNVPINGFLTPLHGDINSTLSLFVGEGDKYITGDKLYVDNTGINTTNAFDSSITDVTRDPSISNNQGIDIQNHDISNIINNGDTEANIKFTTTQDTYFPSVVVFTTDLYEPRVCYYISNIKDDDNNTIFKDKHFISGAKIDPTKQYTFSLWIANKPKKPNDTNIENAKKVQIYVHAHDFNYTSNSTQIKNIGWSAYKNITDQVGDDIGDYNSSTENFTWRLGSGADATQGGEIDVTNSSNDNSSKAFIKLKGRFSNIGNDQTSIDISKFYNFKASFQTNSITITPNDALPIESCVDMNTSADIYVHPQGLFDAWDTFRSINDRNISTKIVGQQFELTIASINSANDAAEAKNGIDMQYQLYDMNNSTNLTSWKDYNATSGKDGAYATKSFTVNSARKNVRVRFKFCGHNNGSGLVLSSLNNCPSADINTSTYSSDNFAVRPNKFYIDINGTAPRKAGKNYDIDFEALDGNNKSSKDYNETAGNNFQIDINETKPGCKTGIFQPNIKNGWHFNDGNYSVDENYSEVGKVQITIKENKSCSSKFAAVDCKDKNITGHWNTDSNLTITPYDENITFTPDHFKINAFLSNNNGQNFTYISRDLNMSAILDINVTAETKNNTITTNYNSACYAQKTDYNISYASLNISPSNALTRILYVETNTSTEGNNSISSNDINLTDISSSIFSTDHNGTGTIRLKINFDRNTSQAVNPFDLNVADLNVTDINGTKGDKILDKNATFYYGRIHAPDYSSENNTTISNAKIYYEVYCKDCNKTKFTLSDGKEGVDSIYWYINNSHVSKDGNISGFLNSWTHATSAHLTFIPQKSPNNILNGIETHNITYDGKSSYPYKKNIDMNASLWLIYNPYDETAKYNSFNVEFYGVGGWSGVGDINNTVDLNISTKKSKRIEW